MLYTLKHPVKYTADKTCKALEFRRPKGKEAKRVFSIISALMPIAEGKPIPDDAADHAINFVSEFAEVVGDPTFPAIEIANQLDVSDVWAMMEFITENFI